MSTIDTSRPASTATYDIVCLGEVLVEVATQAPFGFRRPLNVAASAAAAGARVGLVAVATDDELGHAIATRVAELGISTDLLHFAPGQQGVYLVHSDPNGEREFAYARSGSIGSSLSPDHLPADVISTADAVVASGISCAISHSGCGRPRCAVPRPFAYDPSYRPRLPPAGPRLTRWPSSPHQRSWSRPHPGETAVLLGADPALAAGRGCTGFVRTLDRSNEPTRPGGHGRHCRAVRLPPARSFARPPLPPRPQQGDHSRRQLDRGCKRSEEQDWRRVSMRRLSELVDNHS